MKKMTVRRVVVCLVLFALLFCLAACTAEEVDAHAKASGEQIGSVNGVPVYQSEFDACFSELFMNEYNNYYLSYYYYYGIDLLDEESSRDYIAYMEEHAWDMVVEGEILLQMAEEEYGLTFTDNYLKDMLSYGEYKNLKINSLYNDIYLAEQEALSAAKDISDEEAQAAYNDAPEQWMGRAASQILISFDVDDEASRAAALAEAEGLIAQLDDGADFAALADEHSDEEGLSGGKVEAYINPFGVGLDTGNTYLDAYVDAVYALPEIGSYTQEPVYTEHGYYIIRLDDVIDDYAGAKAYVAASLKTATDEEVQASIAAKVQERIAAASIENNIQYRFYAPDQMEETALPQTPSADE